MVRYRLQEIVVKLTSPPEYRGTTLSRCFTIAVPPPTAGMKREAYYGWMALSARTRGFMEQPNSHSDTAMNFSTSTHNGMADVWFKASLGKRGCLLNRKNKAGQASATKKHPRRAE